MYAACTHEMLHAMDFGLLAFLPPVFLMVALMAWALAFWGLVLDQLRRLGLLQRPSLGAP